MSERPKTKEEEIKEELQEQAYHVERRAFWNRGEAPIKSFPGLCGTCKYLRLCGTRYGGLRKAMCSVFEMPVDPRDPVDECTEYWRRGQLTLPEMVDRSVLIGSVGRSYADERLYL